MGGYGSGRWGGKPTCESYHSIDLAYLRSHGFLKSGRSSTMSWSRGEHQTGSISLIAQHDGVRLLYRTKDRDGAPINVSEFVPFVYTATMFGGRRQWLQCVKCGRGCRKIYGGRYFRCRLCHGLAYGSQSEQAGERAMGRADKIAKRLHKMWGGATEDAYEFPPKPPRMRWITYQRLEAEYDRLRDRWLCGALTQLG